MGRTTIVYEHLSTARAEGQEYWLRDATKCAWCGAVMPAGTRVIRWEVYRIHPTDVPCQDAPIAPGYLPVLAALRGVFRHRNARKYLLPGEPDYAVQRAIELSWLTPGEELTPLGLDVVYSTGLLNVTSSGRYTQWAPGSLTRSPLVPCSGKS